MKIMTDEQFSKITDLINTVNKLNEFKQMDLDEYKKTESRYIEPTSTDEEDKIYYNKCIFFAGMLRREFRNINWTLQCDNGKIDSTFVTICKTKKDKNDIKLHIRNTYTWNIFRELILIELKQYEKYESEKICISCSKETNNNRYSISCFKCNCKSCVDCYMNIFLKNHNSAVCPVCEN